jgi:hypothetical protein
MNDAGRHVSATIVRGPVPLKVAVVQIHDGGLRMHIAIIAIVATHVHIIISINIPTRLGLDRHG